MTTPKCNGYSFGAAEYSVTTREMFRQLLPTARLSVRNELVAAGTGPSGTYEFGARFHNDNTVLYRIQSAATEAQFLENPSGWIAAGLRDCAGADHWYRYEKEWD